MDLAGCPLGYFTDRILVYHPEDPLIQVCDAPVAGWLTLNILLCVLRIGLTFHAKFKKRSKSRGVAWTIVLMQIIFVVLVSTNVANTVNSVSGVLYALLAISFSAHHFFYLQRLVLLGQNIIPLSKQFKTALKDNSVLSELHLADNVIRSLSASALILVVAILIIFIIGAAVYPGEFWPFEAGFLLTGTYQIVLSSIANWQIQRCKTAVQRIADGPINIDNVDFRRQVNRAVWKMAQQQLVIVICSIPVAVLCILCALDIIPMMWWIFSIFFFGGDTLMVFLLPVMKKRHCCKRKKASVPT